MRYEGIIFDLNGVLWWDGPLQEQSWQLFAERVRGRALSGEEMAVHVHGRTNRHTLETLAGRALDGQEVAVLAEQKESIYRRLCLAQGEGFRLSPGAEGLLDFLAEHQVARTIATASGRRNLEFFVDHLALGRWFRLELIAYDDGSRPGKPAPDMYLQAAGNLGLAPARCVVVEDSRSGVEAAHAAGAGWILALGPRSLHGNMAGWPGVSGTIVSLADVPKEELFR